MRFSRKIATLSAAALALTLAGAGAGAALGKTVREEDLPPLPGQPAPPPAAKPAPTPPAANPAPPPTANPAPPPPAPTAKPTPPPAANPAPPPPSPAALGWGGQPAETVAALIPRLPARPRSLTLADLQRRLLLAAPAGGDAPRLALLRAERLLAMGRAEDALTVLATVPGDDPARARIEAEALLVARGAGPACAAVQRAIKAKPSAYLERAAVACLAIAGEHARAAVALAAANKGRAAGDDPLAALVEALDQGGDTALPNLARADAWTLAVAAASRRAWPADTARIAAPPLARLVAASRNDPVSIRIAAAERAVSAGALAAEPLGSLYVLPSFKPDELAAAASLPLAKYGPMGRALLYQAVRGAKSAETRMAVLAHWSRLARAEGDLALAGRALALLMRGAGPDPALRRHAAEIARALFLNGDVPGGLAWAELLRQAAFKDMAAYRRVAALADLAGAPPAHFAAEREAWQAEIASGAEGERRLAVYRALAAALGRDGAPARPAGDGLARLFATLGEAELAKAPPALIGEIAATLEARGLHAEARRFALEAALAAGL